MGPWDKYAEKPGPWTHYGDEKTAPTATIGPGEEPSWFDQAEQDLLHGGNSTILGRTLGRLQGSGDKGYSGLESGVGPGVARFMGSPELGLLQGTKGIAEDATGHPLEGMKDSALGALKALTIPGSVILPEEIGASEELPTVFGIPNKGHAGRMLQEILPIAEKTGTMVNPTESAPALESWRELMQAGGKPAGQKGITSLEKLQLGTLKKPLDPSAMPWADARLRYSNIAEQGREPVLQRLMGRGMTPKVRAAATGVQSGLRKDLSAAAESMGQGQKFEDAMREYRRAAQLSKIGKVGGGLLLGEAARRTGLLGNWIHRTALQQ